MGYYIVIPSKFKPRNKLITAAAVDRCVFSSSSGLHGNSLSMLKQAENLQKQAHGKEEEEEELEEEEKVCFAP